MKVWSTGEELLASDLNNNFAEVYDFGGDGSDGALDITSGTTTIDLFGADIVIKNYTSINIASGATLAFSNPATNGTIVIFKSQGDVTIAGTIDDSGIGASANQNGLSLIGAGPTTGYTSGVWSNSSGYSGNTVSIGGRGTGILYPTYHSKGLPIFCGAGGQTGYGGSGGRGGGGLYIECAGAWNFTGTISVAGKNGTTGGGLPAGTYYNMAAGAGGGGAKNGNAGQGAPQGITGGVTLGSGGGGGGSLLVVYKTLTANTGTVNVSGGLGSTGTYSGGNGGDGSYNIEQKV